ncbi:hypothetical protein M3181_22010 [Mesobacillus maritimus]|uniref:hypothetical protein n=1 Tax=Mesobacillus maritimus TaxID=1643336 RepID=UPI00203B1CE0|nr:hypothetical protein [Mesobacillus maritimus]MCM3671635.1 hypothetical protein [Mesobacillus maritimus]
MSSFDKYLAVYDKNRDIERSAKKIKQRKSVKLVRELFDLEEGDLPQLIGELRNQDVSEKRINEICDQWYGLEGILFAYKDKESELLGNLKSGKANIADKGKNRWIDRDSAMYAFLLQRLGEKVNGK